MSRGCRHIVLCLLLLLFSVGTSATMLTERYNVSYLDLKNGLPHNNVSSIFVDSSGFLWVGTYGGGLVRYDGYGMMSPVMWLKSNSCKSIAEDRFKRLWVAFDEGTNIIDLRTMSGVFPETLDKHLQQLLSESSTKTYCDAMGRLWLVTYSTVNMLTFDEKGHVAKICSYAYHGNTPDVSIRDVEGNGRPWIGVDGGLFRLVEKNGKLVREEISPQFRVLNGLYITDMMKRDNYIWITTNHGLFRYDPYQQQMTVYRLSHDFLSSLALTSDNRLLVGSLSGVNVYDDATDGFSVWNTASNPPLKSDFVHCLLVDKGLIWVGTESGGIAKLVPRQLLLQNYVHTVSSASLSPNPVNAMYVEPDGTLWVGTVEGGLNRREGEKEGRSEGEKGFTHFTKENSALSHNSVSALVADGKGRLWTGTWGGGLNVVDLASQTVYKVEMPVEAARLTNYIGALAYDAINDALWIGSNDGVFFYDLQTKQLQEPFDECQLIRGCIGSIIDNDGKLWIGCMQGVCVIDLKSRKNGKFSFRGLRYRLDIPESRIYDKISSFCLAKDGTLWLGSNGYGLYRRRG